MARRRRSMRGSPASDHGTGLDVILSPSAGHTPATPESGPDETSGIVAPSTPGSTLLGNSTLLGKEPTINPNQPSKEDAPTSLAASLASFALSDVLSLLASTLQTGEVRVVSDEADGGLWVTEGVLTNARVGKATTIGQAVFELACVEDGWIYFTPGVVSSSGQPAASVVAVLTEVGPQIDEWRELRNVVPLQADVSLSPDPPGSDVQIRSDQWRVLTAIGNTGRPVKALLDDVGGDPIVALRTLRALHAAGLITLSAVSGQGPRRPAESSTGTADRGADISSSPPPAPGHSPDPAARLDQVQPSSPVSQVGYTVPPSTNPAGATLAPPLTSDPWASLTDSGDTAHDGATNGRTL